MRRLALLLLPSLLGCGTTLGVQYSPSRMHYRSYEELHGVEARRIAHVSESTWAVHWLVFVLNEPNVRGEVERALGPSPGRYASNLNVVSRPNFLLFPLGYLMLNLTRIRVDFDVVEVSAPAEPRPGP